MQIYIYQIIYVPIYVAICSWLENPWNLKLFLSFCLIKTIVNLPQTGLNVVEGKLMPGDVVQSHVSHIKGHVSSTFCHPVVRLLTGPYLGQMFKVFFISNSRISKIAPGTAKSI